MCVVFVIYDVQPSRASNKMLIMLLLMYLVGRFHDNVLCRLLHVCQLVSCATRYSLYSVYQYAVWH